MTIVAVIASTPVAKSPLGDHESQCTWSVDDRCRIVGSVRFSIRPYIARLQIAWGRSQCSVRTIFELMLRRRSRGTGLAADTEATQAQATCNECWLAASV